MSCDLTKYTYKTTYSTPKDVVEFYSQALREAKIYKRASAYFSLGSFKYLDKSLPAFILNKGYMQLILSTQLTKEVIEQINKGYLQKSDQSFALMSNKFIADQIANMCKSEDSDIFAYLIATGKLDVKLACKTTGIFHDKFGYISDDDHEMVYIGSNNFSENGMANNDELFSLTIGWEDASLRDKKTINEIKNLFDTIWQNNKDGVLTIDMPDPFVDELVKNIDYEKIKKYTQNPDYIRFDVIDKNIEITSNLELESLLTYSNIGEYKFFCSVNGKKSTVRGLDRASEIKGLKDLLIKLCKQSNISFFETKRASDFFDLHLRNYKELSFRGVSIKSPDYKDSDDFDFYFEYINSLLKRPLKEMQIVAAAHIIETERSLNFSVPGSGKTATVLGAFEYLSQRTHKGVDKLLIIGPKNCAKSWKDEYDAVSKQSSHHSPLCLINDDSKSEKIEVLVHDFVTSRIIIVNYELIPKIKDELLKLVDERTMVVFDEIHRIKRTNSLKYEALKEIVYKTRYRVALTGTPLPNGYIDLYNMMSLLHDEYTATYFNMFESCLKSDDAIYRKTGIQNIELNRTLSPFFIRVTKKDLNVPPCEPDHLIYIEANEREKELYKKVINSQYCAFEKNIKLLEIGCVPFKCFELSTNEDFETVKFTFENIDKYMTSKLYKLLSVIKENNRKCIVWCQFVDTINLVTCLLNKNGLKAVSIHGSVDTSDRERIIDDFNYSNNIDVLVTNPATLAESVSLHKACHDAHYVELNFNLYQFLQSKDRIHRLGLKESDKTNYFIYFNFYDKNMTQSIDQYTYEALKKKKQLMDKSIENGNFNFESLTGDFEG